MKQLTKSNTYKKIICVFIFTLILLSLLVGLLVWNSLDEAMSLQFEKRGVEMTIRLTGLCADHILFNDPFALYEVVNELKNTSEDVRYVLITNQKGRVLAHTFLDGIPKGLLDVNSLENAQSYNIERINSDEGTILDIMAPIEHGKIGYARVGISEKFIGSIKQQKLKEILLITLLVCIFAALLAAKLTAYITKPIFDLAGIAKEITSGNLERRAEVRTKDEIGELALAFNNMADSLIKINNDKELLLTALQEKEHMRNILLNKLITAQEDERKRISRELHDETSQALTSLIISIRLLADNTSSEYMKKSISEIRDVIAKILTGVRDLAVELRPPSLDELGLVATMKKYAVKYQERFGIEVEFTSDISDTIMDNQVVLALYRIMQECLTNVAKHSCARHVKLILEDRGTHISLIISDDGKGIENGALKKAKEENRIGIYGMQERAEILGGTFNMVSDSSGTTIIISIPNRLYACKEGEVFGENDHNSTG